MKNILDVCGIKEGRCKELAKNISTMLIKDSLYIEAKVVNDSGGAALEDRENIKVGAWLAYRQLLLSRTREGGKDTVTKLIDVKKSYPMINKSANHQVFRSAS